MKSGDSHWSAQENRSFPLSFAQQRLWFLDQWQPGSAVYNIPRAFRLTGPLHIVALEQSLNEIIRRHTVLRTCFFTKEGQPVQVISPFQPLALPIVDLQDLPDNDRELHALRLLTAEAGRPFDLSQGPLYRFILFRLGREEYLLLLAIHHIIFDRWSLNVFLRELSVLYAAFSTGTPSPLQPLPIQYTDFAIWQRQCLQGELLERQLAYWKKQLEGTPPLLELPTDRPRPPVQTFKGAQQSFGLPQRLITSLKTLSRQERVTFFMTLLAAFQTLLYRYTRQEDIVVGTPIAGRTRSELEDLIGFFVNTLVLRTKLSDNPPFRELLSRIRTIALEAYEHQDLPFEKLVEELHPQRIPGYSPLFQVMFALENTPKSILELSGLQIESLPVDAGTAKFDLTLTIREKAAGWEGVFEYNTDLFESTTIIRMAEHLQILLQSIVHEPEQRIGSLPMLSIREQQQLLVEWNNTQIDYPKEACIHELFEAQVKKTPAAIALIFKSEQLTYEELNRCANQLAHRLRALGVGPEVPVGICMERSLEMVIGLLGILKAGGAYVPLDPAYPQERLTDMLADAQVRVLLTQASLLTTFSEGNTEIICLDTTRGDLARESGENLTSGVHGDHLVYIIYTSGSTGRPKGVAITHRALVNQSFAVRSCKKLQADDRCLQLASLGFDVAAVELFPAWLSGATVILWPEQTPGSLTDFLRFVDREKLTVISLSTAYWHEWVSALSRAEAYLPSSLRLVMIGTEQALPERFVMWQKLVGDRVRWCNAYGPTETTITATIYEPLSPSESPELSSVPIGRPLTNYQVYILDEYLNPVPVGVPGELYISGEGLARGYLNCPELTAANFIPHPFSEEAGARLYKTGDLARYLPDGNIEFLGRRDYQVKIRGFRIELGEIEAVLSQYPTVQEAVVIAQERRPGDKWLIAYIVLFPEASLTISELRSFLQQKLPIYMIPSSFIFVDAFSRTSSGKIDRQALPDLAQRAMEPKEMVEDPRNFIEEVLAGIWADVLGRDQVGIYDHFFEVGGHSLLATQVIARLRSALGIEVPLRCLFEAPTLAEFAIRITERLLQEIEELSEDGT